MSLYSGGNTGHSRGIFVRKLSHFFIVLALTIAVGTPAYSGERVTLPVEFNVNNPAPQSPIISQPGSGGQQPPTANNKPQTQQQYLDAINKNIDDSMKNIEVNKDGFCSPVTDLEAAAKGGISVQGFAGWFPVLNHATGKYECKASIERYQKTEANTNQFKNVGAGITSVVGQQQFNSAQQNGQQSGYFNAAANTGFVGAATQAILASQMTIDAKRLAADAKARAADSKDIAMKTAQAKRNYKACEYGKPNQTAIDACKAHYDASWEKTFREKGEDGAIAQAKLSKALGQKAANMQAEGALQYGMAARNVLLSNANKNLANKIDGSDDGFTLPPGGGGGEEENTNQDAATSTDPTFGGEVVAGNTLGPPGIDTPPDPTIDAPPGAGLQKPEGGAGGGPLGSTSLGGGSSTQANKGEKEKSAEYAGQSDASSKYARGGGTTKGGGEDKGPDLSGLLAQFLPKDQDEKGAHSILDFGRQPGNAPISLLDKGVNIFERIHIRYQNEQKNNAVGL